MDKLTIAVYAGNFLKNNEFISATELQKFINEQSEGYNLELEIIRTVLETLVLAEFLVKVGDFYTFKNKTIIHNQVIKQILPHFTREEGFLNIPLEN